MYVKRTLNENLSIYKGAHFPYRGKSKRNLLHTATIGIGGNLLDVKRRFEKLFFYFLQDIQVELVETSLILKNPPFGFIDQDDFFNSIIVLKTDMQADDFLEYLLRIEKKFGRKRSFANAPRTLDLDIIFFDRQVVNTQKLTIPHPHWFERESVVIPLASMSL